MPRFSPGSLAEFDSPHSLISRLFVNHWGSRSLLLRILKSVFHSCPSVAASLLPPRTSQATAANSATLGIHSRGASGTLGLQEHPGIQSASSPNSTPVSGCAPWGSIFTVTCRSGQTSYRTARRAAPCITGNSHRG